MAKKKKKPKPTFTRAEKEKAVALIQKRLSGRPALKGFNDLDEEDQLAAANEFLIKRAKRTKEGAVDWTAFFEALGKFLKILMDILGPLLLKKKS